MIKAIFYSRFHAQRGPIVEHQVPDGAVAPSTLPAAQEPLFNFASVSDYLIPQQEFCDRFVTVCLNRHRIIGFPTCISDSNKYERNEFIFNFCLVLDENTDMSSHRSVVLKLASLFRTLEEQSSILSNATEETAAKSLTRPSKIYAFCEMIMEDLNNYCECMIPIDESNTLNLKLFPSYPPPVPVRAWHVPVSTVRLENLMNNTWDLTMIRVLPFIDGIRSVATIAQLADADLDLTRKAIAHLVYYDCVLLIDIFQFSAIYAPTSAIEELFLDDSIQQDCARYVSTSNALVSRDRIVHLYSNLKQGQTLKAWCIDNRASLSAVDVRRFITFGVIKGFIYRVHKYVYDPNIHGAKLKKDKATNGSPDLSRYLDGLHSFDQICTENEISERHLQAELKARGDVQIIHR